MGEIYVQKNSHSDGRFPVGRTRGRAWARTGKVRWRRCCFVSVTELWPALEMAGDIEGGHLEAIEIYEKAAAHPARAILDEASSRASSAQVTSEIRHVKDRKPAQGILETAKLENCDLIVMASHGRRGLQKLLLGSQTAEVIALSKLPVLVLR